MAATGYTPIQLYYSTTASAVPTAGNLASGELAINITDGKLYYKSNAGVVTLLAGATAGPAGGSNTQVQFNSSGALAGSANMTFNGTTLTVNDLTDSSLTAGRVTFAGTAGNLTDSANMTFSGTLLTVSGGVTLTTNAAKFSSTFGGVTTTNLFTDSGGGVLSVDGSNTISLRTGGVSGTSVVVASPTGLAVTGTFTSSGAGTINGTSLDINPASGNPNITLRSGNTFRGYIEGNSTGMLFGVGPAATTAITILNNLNVGIGANPSSYKLQVQSDGLQVRLQASTNTNQGLTLGYNYSGGYSQINSDEAGVNQKDLWYTALNHYFGRNTSSALMTLDASGFWKLGTTGYGTRAVIYGTNSAIGTTVGGSNTGMLMLVSSETASTNYGPEIVFSNTYSAPSTIVSASIAGTKSSASGSGSDQYEGNLLFKTSTWPTGLRTVGRFGSSGNFGVGTDPNTIIEASRDSGLSTGTGTTVALRLSDTSQDGGAGTWNQTQQFTAVQFYSADASGVGAGVRASVGATMESSTGGSSALTFFTNSSGTNTERGRFTSDGIFKFNSGYGSVANAYGCRAWGNLDGNSLSVLGAGNISSITQNSTGNYNANFTTSMPDANYSCVGNAENLNDSVGMLFIPYNYYTNRINFLTTTSGSYLRARIISLAVFR